MPTRLKRREVSASRDRCHRTVAYGGGYLSHRLCTAVARDEEAVSERAALVSRDITALIERRNVRKAVVFGLEPDRDKDTVERENIPVDRCAARIGRLLGTGCETNRAKLAAVLYQLADDGSGDYLDIRRGGEYPAESALAGEGVEVLNNVYLFSYF